MTCEIIANTNIANLAISDLGISLCNSEPNVLSNMFSKHKLANSLDLANALANAELTLVYDGRQITNLAQLCQQSTSTGPNVNALACWTDTFSLNGLIQAKAIDFTKQPICILKDCFLQSVYTDMQAWQLEILRSQDSGQTWQTIQIQGQIINIALQAGQLLRLRGLFNTSQIQNPCLSLRYCDEPINNAGELTNSITHSFSIKGTMSNTLSLIDKPYLATKDCLITNLEAMSFEISEANWQIQLLKSSDRGLTKQVLQSFAIQNASSAFAGLSIQLLRGELLYAKFIVTGDAISYPTISLILNI